MKNKKMFLLFALTSLMVWGPQASCQFTNAGSSTYVASTPCSAGTRPLPGIPKDAGCELIKWKLTLSASGASAASGTYSLDCYYGMPKQGTRDFINGGTRLQRRGRWINHTDMPGNPDAIVCQLDPGKNQVSISFLRVNSNLLHLLDAKQHLMIGTGAWSYTLNKTKP
jgi:hypothetical protein